jgi:superoxide dismutase, Cu-Zn family
MRQLHVLCLLAACDAPPTSPAPRDDAWARVEPLAEGGPSGVARFRDTARGTRVIVELDGLSPGAHGLYIGSGADCATPGAHFDPAHRRRHGGPLGAAGARHAGDLGNIVQDWRDASRYHHVDPVLTLDGGQSIFGHPIVVTSGRDDLSTDPDGQAGPPIACGLVSAVR